MAVATKIIGILNITPDSFSDGGKYFSLDDAIKHIYKIIEDEVDVIDIGGESTRPNAIPTTYEEEWDRLKLILPRLIKIAHEYKVEVSIDTRKPQVAQHALDMGVDYINDVSGCESEGMLKIVKQYNAKVIIMHHLTIPSDKNVVLPKNINVVSEVNSWIKQRASILMDYGVEKDNIIIDPGLGFGKTSAQSWKLLKNISELKSLGFKICVGHSRKSMFGLDNELDRDFATVSASNFLLQQGIDYIRVHNVRAHSVAFKVWLGLL